MMMSSYMLAHSVGPIIVLFMWGAIWIWIPLLSLLMAYIFAKRTKMPFKKAFPFFLKAQAISVFLGAIIITTVQIAADAFPIGWWILLYLKSIMVEGWMLSRTPLVKKATTTTRFIWHFVIVFETILYAIPFFAGVIGYFVTR